MTTEPTKTPGRPTVNKHTIALYTFLDSEVFHKLAALAQKEGRSKSNMAAKIITDYLALHDETR